MVKNNEQKEREQKMEVGFSEKYVNPYTDFGFKKLFGTELNKDFGGYFEFHIPRQ